MRRTRNRIKGGSEDGNGINIHVPVERGSLGRCADSGGRIGWLL
jgi:hypothetical protein